MPRFFQALQPDGFTHDRVHDLRRESIDDRSCAPLRMIDFLPERHGAQSCQFRFRKFGPRQCFRVENLMRVDELLAKERFMRVGPGFERHAASCLAPLNS